MQSSLAEKCLIRTVTKRLYRNRVLPKLLTERAHSWATSLALFANEDEADLCDFPPNDGWVIHGRFIGGDLTGRLVFYE